MRTLMRTQTALLLVMLCLSAPALAQDDTLNLRPSWAAGQTAVYEYKHERTRKTTVSFRGNSRDSTMAIASEGRVTWVVDKVNADGSAVCTMTHDWLVTTIDAADQKLVNDSRKAKGDNEAMHKLLKAVAGKPLTFNINADGSVESVKGTNKMRSAIGKDFEELVPDDLDFIESASDMVTLPFVPTELAVGAGYKADFRWTHDMGHTDQAWEFNLAGVEDVEGLRVATVTGKGKIKLDVDRSEIPDDAPPIDIKMTQGEAESQVFFDLSRREALGRYTSERQTVEVLITLPQGQGRMKRVMEQESQGHVLRVEER